ncbi:MAG: efflux RND transporter periplasmic adaptor subunit [Oscillospiraceae bacterium]|nr:efflux RND transporter periplasmic adaptor subunit [Oscillospiraceae bacterium]
MSNEATTAITEDTEETQKKKGKGKAIAILIITLALAAGVFFGVRYFVTEANYVVTENARVTTNLTPIISMTPGRLERFTLYEGRIVSENEVLGWVENSESFRSPYDGIVVRSFVQQDQMVSPMDTLAVIADLNNLHIQANIEETYITRVRIGQEVTVHIDALGRQQFTGRVAQIGRVTDAELTGTAMFFNTGGTFTKVTQLIPVEIVLEDGDINLEDFIGLNATVRIPLA